MVVSGKGGHIGGDMSVIDVLVALYFKEMNISPKNMDDPDRDRFVMSKGHSVEAYYAVLAAKGFFPMEEVIEKFFKFGSPYIGHPNINCRHRDEFRFSRPRTSGLRGNGAGRKNG